MSATKSFRDILDEKLGKSQGSAASQGTSRSTSSGDDKVSSQKAADFELNQYLNNLFERAGTRYFFRENPYGSTAKVSDSHAREKTQQLEQEIKREPAPKPEPPPRTKRILSFDQEKALELLNKFGAAVDSYSTDSEIKNAYRKLAKKFHPDAHAGKEKKELERLENCFKQISRAYALLT